MKAEAAIAAAKEKEAQEAAAKLAKQDAKNQPASAKNATKAAKPAAPAAKKAALVEGEGKSE